ncbi:MAG: hypothetical protein N2596_06470 [Syntrophorhabdaceae bacterium]|nr:hypothetical protein [Syntrophorhabdaceae bacterium]
MKFFRKRDDSLKNLSFPLKKEKQIARSAYVPEHIITLMEAISGGTPGLLEEFLFFIKDDILMFIGYPLYGIENDKNCIGLIEAIKKLIGLYDPSIIFLIAPEIPIEIKKYGTEFQRDYYYTLNVETFKPERRLMREVEKASRILKVKKEKEFTEKHRVLTDEFLKTNELHPIVASLYNSMDEYFKKSETALILSAITEKDELSAFYCLDYGADHFLAYILGCHSKINYIPHASDLLFFEMVNIARELNKKEINLGLGVNEGIRRFKEKWGGRPSIPYKFMEWKRKPVIDSLLKTLQSKL